MNTRFVFRAIGRSRGVRVTGLAVVLALPVAAAAVPAGARPVRSFRLQAASAAPRDSRGGIGLAAATALRNGPLPADGAELARGKAAAARWVGDAAGRTTVAPALPTVVRSFEGINDPGMTPPDSTSAIGTKRLIELVNNKAAIYSRSGSTPLATGTLNGLTGSPASDFVVDPQIMWDGQTKRFYYAAADVVSVSTNYLAVGFSKTASPASFSDDDWCQYTVSYGSVLPDYPKLGDSQAFMLVGVNAGVGGSVIRSDIVAVSKPSAGTACPDPATFKVGAATSVKTATGAAAFTPVPAQQTDTNKTGWVVARPASVPVAGATALTVFKVTKNGDGSPNIQGTGTDVDVSAYRIPANAPQKGASQLIDTMDGRNLQAVSAIDPGHGNKVALWTEHTVLGGAGAEVRWYEIDPAAASLLQSGKVSSASLYRFNGAISPDRRVAGATKQFGDSMVMVFNSSSSTTDAKIWMVSKIGTGAQSAPVIIRTSPGPDIDMSCPNAGDVCRWGDYASATPDPASPTGGTHGVVWLASQWNANSTNATISNWRTQNVVAQP